MNYPGRNVHCSKVVEECVVVKGAGVFHQDVAVETIKVIGHCKIKAGLTANELINKGTSWLKDCRVKSVRNVGSLTAETFESDKVDTSGGFTSKGNVITKTFRAKGAVRIKGLLDSEKIDMELVPGSSIGHVRSTGEIVIIQSRLSLFSLVGKKPVIDAMEAPFVKVKGVAADHIVGENVSIGSGCNIQKVTYKDHLDVHPGSTVVSTEKM